MLLRLARPSGNMEVTSNRVKRSELYFLAKDRINEVLGRLSKEGLIRITKGEVEDNDQVEVAHEALVRNWPLLAGWLETERGAMRQRVRLTSAAEQWQENTKDDGGLIGGELLKQALAYDDLNELEMEFVKASKEAAERAKWEKKNAAEREQELEREKLLALEAKAEALQGRTLALQGKAEEQARSALRLRRYVFALILLTLLTSVAATAAILQSRRASASGRDAEIKAAEAKRQTTLAEESARIATWEKVTADQERARATENERLATIASEKAETESRKAKEEKARAERLLVEATAAKARAVKLADELAEKVKLEKERSDKLTAEQMRREEESRIESEKQANITNKRREAARYTKRRNYLAAIVEYEELLELYKETKDKRSEIDILIETARAYRSLGDEMKKNRSYAAQAEEYFKESDSAFMKAVALLDQEINIKKSEAGGDNTVVIDAYEDLARLYAEHSKADESAETYKAALKYQEASLTSDDVFSQILYEDVFQQLATLYKEGKEPRLRELEGIYKERVDKYLVLYKETVDPDLMLSLKELADFYLSQERFEEAERHYKQSLDIVQRYGNDGPVNYGYLLDSIYGLGETNYRKLNYVAAEGHFRSILDRMKATPEMYPYADEDISAKTKERLGDVLVDQKKLQVAAQFYADAVESYKELNWEEAKTKQADTLRKLAEVKFDLSNASSPERNALRRQAAEALSSAFVVNPALKENPDANLILFVRNLTRAGFAENTDAEIKKLYDGLMVVLVSPYEKSLAAHEQIILKSGQIAASKERAGYEEDFVQVERIYKEQADFSKLEDLYKRALKVREKLYGGIDQYQVYNTFRALGALYRDSKKFELAEGSYTQALEIIKRVFKTSNSYFLAESSKDLATVYAELKKFKEAETLYKQAIFIYEKLDLDKSPLMADTFKGYAKLLRLMGRETEAREKEREAEKIRAD
ncbi:MAG TPA: tetratricopeptide repeat protein [Pyrinomonadaceae bacterium]|nr:tetratricopeptide repeat protein [Pyrinomonadaceae bacterium]